jgi:hypothetical protein
LARCSEEPIELIVHDDGTLDEQRIEPLRQAYLHANPSGEMVFISRAAADPVMRRALANYPACDRFRETNIFGLKLFDVAILATMRRETSSGPISYCDGDIYFFKRFRKLFSVPERCDGVFLRDANEMIAWRSWQVLARRVRFVSRLNAGLFCIRPALFDLSRLERYFQHQAPPILKHFVEQSAWALLAAQARDVRMWDPIQLSLAHPELAVTDQTVAVHYVQTYRNLLDRDTTSTCLPPVGPAVQLRAIPATTVGAWSVAVEELRRFLHRRGRR